MTSKLVIVLLSGIINTAFAQVPGINKQVYTWKTPPSIGTYLGKEIYLGGFSGLHYIKGSDMEFYAVTDRGANLDANECKKAIQIAGPKNSAKLFPIPGFHPQIIHLKAQADSLKFLGVLPLKRPDGTATTGLINPANAGYTGELAFTDTSGTSAKPDVWGIDSEGLFQDASGNFFICEEYGPSIWKTDNTGRLIHRYTPYGALPGAQKQDIAIDSVFKYRNPNKGFEGIAVTPNGKIYGFLQNTLLFPANDTKLKKNTCLDRFIEIDPATNTTRMLGYEHDEVQVSGALSSIKNDKRYIGDAVAINNNEILVLEHGKHENENYAKLYIINIAGATPLNPTNNLGYGGKSFEQLLDSATAKANGINVVKKTLFLDLIANGYDANIEKQEGLTIINNTTVAIANDNDFGVVSKNEDGIASDSGVKSTITVFTVPQSMKLNYTERKIK